MYYYQGLFNIRIISFSKLFRQACFVHLFSYKAKKIDSSINKEQLFLLFTMYTIGVPIKVTWESKTQNLSYYDLLFSIYSRIFCRIMNFHSISLNSLDVKQSFQNSKCSFVTGGFPYTITISAIARDWQRSHNNHTGEFSSGIEETHVRCTLFCVINYRLDKYCIITI